MYWRKKQHVDILWDVYHRYTFQRAKGAREEEHGGVLPQIQSVEALDVDAGGMCVVVCVCDVCVCDMCVRACVCVRACAFGCVCVMCACYV